MGADIMNSNSINSVLYRIFAFATLALLVLAVIEAVVKEYKYTIVHERYEPGRLVELAAMSAIFTITLLLRQIREELRRKRQ
jgi:hypothetical protein